MTAADSTRAGRETGQFDYRQGIVKLIPSLRAFARSLCHNAAKADDLMQDCILKALSKKDSFTPGTNLRAWLFTILRNHYYSQLRKGKREVEDIDGTFAARLSTRSEQDGAIDLEDLRRAYMHLTPEHQEVLGLVGAEGQSYKSAALIIGCAVGTVKSRVNRARRNLRKLLGDYEHQEDADDYLDRHLALARERQDGNVMPTQKRHSPLPEPIVPYDAKEG